MNTAFVETITCAACKTNKPTVEFYRDRRKKNGRYSSCRTCSCNASAKSAKKHKEKTTERARKWRKKNIVRIRNLRRLYMDRNKERIATRIRNWRSLNREHLREYSKQYIKLNRKKISEYVRTKSRTDVHYRLSRQLRSRLADALRGRQRSASAVANLGCTIPELKTYLSSLWLAGMNWENWGRGPGKWHIDHIRPLASFDITNPEQQKAACHYTNLQPLWEEDNLHKNGPRRPKIHRPGER